MCMYEFMALPLAAARAFLNGGCMGVAFAYKEEESEAKCIIESKKLDESCATPTTLFHYIKVTLTLLPPHTLYPHPLFTCGLLGRREVVRGPGSRTRGRTRHEVGTVDRHRSRHACC